MLRAKHRASVVFPSPGTSSTNKWPSENMATTASRTTSDFPWITLCTLSEINWYASPGRIYPPPFPLDSARREAAAAVSARAGRGDQHGRGRPLAGRVGPGHRDRDIGVVAGVDGDRDRVLAVGAAAAPGRESEERHRAARV